MKKKKKQHVYRSQKLVEWGFSFSLSLPLRIEDGRVARSSGNQLLSNVDQWIWRNCWESMMIRTPHVLSSIEWSNRLCNNGTTRIGCCPKRERGFPGAFSCSAVIYVMQEFFEPWNAFLTSLRARKMFVGNPAMSTSVGNRSTRHIKLCIYEYKYIHMHMYMYWPAALKLSFSFSIT